MLEKKVLNKINFNWPVVGHKNIINFLEKSILNNNLSQAYIFSGPKHLGKSKLAEILVANILCQGKVRPCGECPQCKQLKTGIHPDIFKVQREEDKSGKLKKNIAIEQVRLLKNNLAASAFLKSYKFAIIFEAERLNEAASNGLLKTLEEPTGNTVLILITNQIEKILPTIRSRCQIIQFLPVDKKKIIDHLADLSGKTKLSQTLANLCHGRPGVAIDFLNNQEKLEKHTNQTELLIDLFNQNITERFKSLGGITSQKRDSQKMISEIELLLDNWLLALRDIMLIKNLASQFVANQKIIEKSENFKNLNNKSILKLISNINEAKIYLGLNANPQLVVENLVLTF